MKPRPLTLPDFDEDSGIAYALGERGELMEDEMPRSLLGILVLAISIIPAGLASGQPLLIDGEILNYEIRYAGIPAGYATLEVECISDTASIFRITSRARSNKIVSVFYEVDDRIVTEFDASDLKPRYFEKSLKEGNYRKYEVISYGDRSDGSMRFEPGTFDVLTALYCVRGERLEVGQELSLRLIEGEESYDARIKVLRRETVKTGSKHFDCYVIEPEIKEGPFARKGRLLIWLTADDLKLPVQLKSEVAIGSFVACLSGTSYRGGAL